ncbi:MAG: endolytic transglycosylase MltG [Bacillota bacterium]|jgi:UPF0755 protein|nr:endolytic transglycosylase MltG [Bacillota bacterium]MDD3297606.1 endolytic transglycosylase MltG [Bacillota bacterium]MDD3851227.1 endolytic transglycosylase MltG [Bacillota bacterium]MDD4707457.1 endolytic transglycosylase MltG [Bacillota bacterium]
MKDSAATVRTGAKRKRRAAVYIAVLALAVLIGVSLFVQQFRPVAVEVGAPEAVQVEIPIGSTVSQIGKILADKGIIRSELAFRIVTRLEGYQDSYQAGLYLLSVGSDLKGIMDEITKGSVYKETVRFTIPEGYELRQIADLLYEKGIADREEFMKEVKEGSFSYRFIEKIPVRENRLEGYLFPDTYEVFIGETANSIIDRMLGRFEEVAREVGLLDLEGGGMTMDEIVTLASVVEREAGTFEELPLVSAVFHNRLRIGMNLGSCATVQYVLKERKPRLSTKDTQIDSPYNTYIMPGLPVGPIASPGREALKAAMEPAESDYLYFVATNEGTNVFSDNYQQFLRDKEKYR